MKTKFNEFHLLPNNLKIQGIVLFGIVLLQKQVKNYPENIRRTLFNHERIHVRQWIEMLFIPFGLWYLMEFVVRYVQYRNWDLAYRNISFEREAYLHESNTEYLSQRPFWAWIKYL